MLVFGIDTCCMAATAALVAEDRLVAQTVQNNKKTHSQRIMPMIEQMLYQAEIELSDIDCFAAAAGPGSFTGVRIGVATVKALAHAAGKPCVAVSTLQALANNVACFDGIICPIMDARRNQVYNALFKGESMERITEDRAISIDDLLSELKETEGKIIFNGDGVAVFADKIKEELGERAVFARRMQMMNLAASVAEIGCDMLERGETIEYTELSPQYLRLSQAERERLEKENKA
ncbi:MAG: tRNA (adenosine(37)-N6)-threonylcarbamoyltransferase complex dimerization subunit type 1 TsaB [Clostridia bacterium]|nr:tRNA (adenosine(37)-N6)-threonylcarbamoyltransferase complex dimerization subunit type 1 TsaB [Clostridia bacterium]